jgi:hypothetical protein
MKGQFKNRIVCIDYLKSMGFIYFKVNFYANFKTQEIAEINVYSDGSTSAMFGKFSGSTQ